MFEAQGLTKTYGVVKALSDVSIRLGKGEFHAVIGENGAGKSTLMNIICGRVQPDSGSLFREGSLVKFHAPRDAQNCGIAIAPQEINLVPNLSVAENICLGAHENGNLGAIDWRRTRQIAEKYLHEIDESIDPNQSARLLSKAEQQLVQIARAASSSAEILIFDEPTAALTSRETDKLFSFIKRFLANGNSLFYISHRLEEILQFSHRITVLRDGEKVSELNPASTNKDEMVREMAGRKVTPAPHRPLTEISSEVVLKIEDLSRDNEFEKINFELKKGEIIGVAGLIGAGRTELGRCLFGVTKPNSGKISIFGEEVTINHPADAIKRGLVYLPEERKQDGIFELLSIRENMCISVLKRFQSGFGINISKMAHCVSNYIESLKIKIGNQEDAITSLSGGNQQKVILARWLMKESKILILDEPTRGIDVNAKAEIQSVLKSVVNQGLSVIYISSELQEVIDVSDRILVLHEGKLKGTVAALGSTQESLLALAMS